MISASGSMTGSRSRISLSSMRQNAITGAPMRSEPKLGNACAWRPSRNAATDEHSAPETTPCPPRPWMRTWNIALLGFRRGVRRSKSLRSTSTLMLAAVTAGRRLTQVNACVITHCVM